MPDAAKSKLKESQCTYAEELRNIHAVTPPAGTEFDVLLEPDYWSHVARRMRPLDRIEAMPEDGSWWAELLVIHTGPVSVMVRKLRYHELDEVDPDEIDNDLFKIKWGGPSVMYRIIRKSDNEVVKDHFRNKSDAVNWMAVNLEKAA